MEIADFAFAPQELHVRVGETVLWVNRDSAAHNVVFTGGGMPGPLLGQNERWALTFNRAGTYEYYCGPRPSMTGQVIANEQI